MVQCAFIIIAAPKKSHGGGGGRGGVGEKKSHQCRNSALLGERHCRDHASEEELARRNSLSDADVRRLRGVVRKSPSSASSATESPAPSPSVTVSQATPPTAKRTKLSRPSPPRSSVSASRSGSGSRSTTSSLELPTELQTLIIDHLDADDLTDVRRNAKQLSPGLRQRFAQKIRECDAPGVCVAVYRGMFADYYRDELRRGAEIIARTEPEVKRGGGGGGGSPESKTAKAVVVAEEEEDEEENEKPPTTRDRSKCAAVCLTNTEAIETLLRAYMVDYDKIGGDRAPWPISRGAIVTFVLASDESVNGAATRVSLSLWRQYPGAPWRLTVQLQALKLNASGAFIRAKAGTGGATYRAADLNSSTWPEPSLIPPRASPSSLAHLRAFQLFMQEALSRALPPLPPTQQIASPSTSSSSSSVQPRSERKVAVAVESPTRDVSLVWNSALPTVFEFVASGDRVASEKLTRTFARVIAATAYAFASVVAIEPSVNHAVAASQTRGSYVSPVPRHIRLLRTAFPTLPIRVLYRGSGQGRVDAGSSAGPNSKSWRNSLSVPEMVGAAIAAGATDVAAVRLA